MQDHSGMIDFSRIIAYTTGSVNALSCGDYIRLVTARNVFCDEAVPFRGEIASQKALAMTPVRMWVITTLSCKSAIVTLPAWP